MSISKPAGAYTCWGLKFQEGSTECVQCRFNDTCRPKMMEMLATPTTRPPQSLPIYGAPRTPTGMVPMPPSAAPAPPPPSYAPPPVAHVRYSPSAPTPPPPPVQQSTYQPYQQQQGFVLPDHQNPNPMAPMYRPGATGPAYYFNQYPEESVAARLTKNVFLRGLEAIFGELMFFFRHWTWPPR